MSAVTSESLRRGCGTLVCGARARGRVKYELLQQLLDRFSAAGMEMRRAVPGRVGPVKYMLLQRYRSAAHAVPTVFALGRSALSGAVLGIGRSALSGEVFGDGRSVIPSLWAMCRMSGETIADGSVGRGSR
ncbi:hypothetical protein [Nocardia anaemiae]|uniref:hypothetical protein n=1 Tax=Nocardia anaemiae TaxID=263910 RepID=UPI0007A3D67F|nr:hypothetical protein [Nocardia anaemiae]